MLYLSDQPNSIERQNLEFVTDNSTAVEIVQYLKRHSRTLVQVNNYLTRNFQKYRSTYQPIEAHNYIPTIPKLTDDTKNILIGINMTLTQAINYQHQPIYLIIN